MTPEQLKDNLLAMLSQAVPTGHSNGITITRPNEQQDFQMTRNIPTNAAQHGSQVDQLVNNIINLDSNRREELSAKLAKAGF